VNQNPSSRPFLRLFSALQSTAGPSDESTKEPCECVKEDLASGKKPNEKMIAGSVGPRSPQSGATAPRRVEVSLAEIAPVLADAINHQRGWLSDFSDDTVSIDADLYEVLLAYQQMRRLNAA